MKTSRTKLRSSLILLTLFSLGAWAKPIAQVTDVTGQVFVVTPNGKTAGLKVKDHLEEKSEIMVEEGGTITINDYYDATYHLVGGSHIKMFDKSVQLKRGKTWVQSGGSRYPLALTTANGNLDFWKCEFIATFDQATSRSQFLVVNGEVEASNILERNMKYTVAAGTFTLIDPEVEDGLPRTPTRVGLQSLNSALAEFKKLPPKMIEATPARSIASVEEAPAPKKGEIVFISSGKVMDRFPASVGSAHSYYKKKTTSKVVSNLTDAPIRFYGTSWKAITHEALAPRSPASVAPMASPVVPQKSVSDLKIDQEFGDSLKKKEAEQPRFTNELRSLIDELKSY